MQKLTWPFVALVALVLGAFLGIYALIPDNEPESRSALIVFMVAAGNGVLAIFVNSKMNAVEKKVDRTVHQTNGGLDERMQQAIRTVQSEGSVDGNAGVQNVGQSGSPVQPPGVAGRNQGASEGGRGPVSW